MTSIVGTPISFRGLIYGPINEQGVVFLFGRVLEDLNMYIEELKTGYPDCIARRYTGKGWERVRIEFEYKSSNFDHDPKGCDIIICWEDDLTEEEKKRLEGLEVIELKSFIKELENKPIEEPDKPTIQEYGLKYHFAMTNESGHQLFKEIIKRFKELNPEIWYKPAKSSITFYSPEKVFIYLHLQKKGLCFHLFTSGESIEGVEKCFSDAPKWGRIHLTSDKDIDKVFNALKRSYDLIEKAIRNNENTGWFSQIETNSFTPEELAGLIHK